MSSFQDWQYESEPAFAFHCRVPNECILHSRSVLVVGRELLAGLLTEPSRLGGGMSIRLHKNVRAIPATRRRERVLDTLAPLIAEEIRVAATLFAAWNDLLLEGAAVGDEVIITEVRERWHTSKARFTPATLQQWLGWLSKNQLIPRSQGRNTRHQAALL